MGLVTPLGVGAPQTWKKLTVGRVATAALTDHSFAQVRWGMEHLYRSYLPPMRVILVLHRRAIIFKLPYT